jgi:hypothetical protein
MTISMYKASVPIFVQFLTSLSAWLDKAAAYAEAKKIDPAVLLNTRLFPDMFPLARQVRAATDHAINACGRLAGVELPTFRSIIGSPETVRSGIEALVAETGADELIVVSDLYDHPARLRSFELIADAAGIERQYVQAPALAHQ